MFGTIPVSMTATRLVGLLVLVVVGLTIAPIASGAVVGAFTDDTDGSDDEPATNASVSTFMQSSAADAENAVDSGMFTAEYENADDDARADIVLDRTDELEERLEELEAEREELRESKDDLHHGQYRAEMTQLTVDIRSLEREIDRTEQRATETGVDADRLGELRENTSELSGPEVAEIARGLAGMDEPPGGGPPDDPGSQDRGPDSSHPPGHDDGEPPADQRTNASSSGSN